MGTQLVVSMPTFRTPRDLLDRAVRSVLDQTYEDLLLVVVNDGGERLSGMPSDSRLMVWDMDRNRGRYFADAVVTRALSSRLDWLWSVHDADDWSEPERFDRLLPHAEDGAVISPYWRHQRGKTWVQEPARDRVRKPTEGFVHIAHWVSGAYTVERVERAGGVHPGFRIGFDTLFVRMLVLTGPVGIAEDKGYHWCRRTSGSLTSSPETRFGSQRRAAAKQRLVRLDREAWDRRHEDPGSVIRESVKPEIGEQVEVEAGRLSEAIL